MVKYGFVENIDFVTLSELSEKREGSRLVKRSIINHALKLNMKKDVFMIQRVAKGKLLSLLALQTGNNKLFIK